MIKNCEKCDILYEAPRSKQKYCSKECQTLASKKPYIAVICSHCNKSINVPQSEAGRKFCSSSCAATSNNSSFPKRKIEGACLTCRTPITTAWKFCEPCRKEKASKPKTVKPVFKLETRFCLQCQKSFKQKALNHKYCSADCRNTFLNGSPDNCPNCDAHITVNSESGLCGNCRMTVEKEAKIQSWLAGHWRGGTDIRLSRVIRLYLLEQADYTCTTVNCGFNTPHPSDGKTVLEIDHADGDGSNHAPSNLRVLCPNCHSLTPSYRGRNAGHGRNVYYLRRANYTT